jgi:hypothetical protein
MKKLLSVVVVAMLLMQFVVPTEDIILKLTQFFDSALPSEEIVLYGIVEESL